MATIEDVRRLVELDNGLASVATVRGDGTVRATVVNAGVIEHPSHGGLVAAFVARPGTRKLADIAARPHVTMQWRAGWAWASLEGETELIGPDNPHAAVDADRLRGLLREVFAAAGGVHEDLAEYDRVMAAERRVVVLVQPARVYTNP